MRNNSYIAAIVLVLLSSGCSATPEELSRSKAASIIESYWKGMPVVLKQMPMALSSQQISCGTNAGLWTDKVIEGSWPTEAGKTLHMTAVYTNLLYTTLDAAADRKAEVTGIENNGKSTIVEARAIVKIPHPCFPEPLTSKPIRFHFVLYDNGWRIIE